ncbi:hypothetical protein COCNU_12G005810 [Cocos nucifera]|uniref:V-type proton ATPase subunit S1/VOA1 transmembrane domain-containing protein n=1 Tax=Cocos nucifera TaxID=13894 RepID=A0A8K0IS42_COCNU|nr:hypothetical protein COCNU_12G005810 [Cocos nucifera]
MAAREEMEGVKAVLLAIVFTAAQLPHVLSFPTTAPAFLWSPHHLGSSQYGVKEVVDYRTISLKNLAKSVLSEGGWSNLVCSGEDLHQNVDVAFIFVGRKLQSSDISKTKYLDQALLDMLKLSFTSSNFSMAFPYVAASDEDDTLENSLISGFAENCGHGLKVNHIAYLDSCSVNGKNLKKLQGLHSVHDFVRSKMEARVSGQTDLIVFCNGGSEELDPTQSEGEVLSELISSLEQSGATYAILYASEPFRSLQYPTHSSLSRFLAEDTSSNGSANSTFCDGVCQIKTSLLEGVFVGIVLLIILISGLCCMMGIDTPTRFETPQES